MKRIFHDFVTSFVTRLNYVRVCVHMCVLVCLCLHITNVCQFLKEIQLKYSILSSIDMWYRFGHVHDDVLS